VVVVVAVVLLLLLLASHAHLARILESFAVAMQTCLQNGPQQTQHGAWGNALSASKVATASQCQSRSAAITGQHR
jgi:hypothetical protein